MLDVRPVEPHFARQAVFGVPLGQYLIIGRSTGKVQTPQQFCKASAVGYAAGLVKVVVVGPVSVKVKVGLVMSPTEFVYESCPITVVVTVSPGAAVMTKTPMEAKSVRTEVLWAL